MSRTPSVTPAFPGIGAWFAAAIVVTLGAPPAVPPAAGQETTRIAADADRGTPSAGAAQLRALGIDLATIEQMDDAALLWRAVRELVLPGKVSIGTQQRLLRQAWRADPEIRHGSVIDSPAH
jgi:hypothetical protein